MESQFCTVEEALEELRAGRLILTIDDPDRENEGDLICAAQLATTENVNFMATHAKGLICTPMSAEIADRLGLEQMVKVNTDNHATAFTVSIDHVDTTTGISAEERGYTCRKCVDPDTRPEDLRRPGHVFPLTARRGGVLVRGGHTEATVDLCRLAGLVPCGLCCEIMRDDGTMMRTTELLEKAGEWGLKVLTIQALQDYCRRHDKHVVREASAHLPTKYGDFQIYGYVNDLTGEHHVALVKGDIGGGENVLCRVHSECLTGDVFGSRRCDCGGAAGRRHGTDRGGGPGCGAVHAPGGPGHRPDQQAEGLRPPGAGAGHRGRQCAPGLCPGPAGVLDRGPDPPGPGGQDHAASHQQPGQDLPAVRLRPGDRGAGSHPDARHGGGPRLSADQAAADGPSGPVLRAGARRSREKKRNLIRGNLS